MVELEKFLEVKDKINKLAAVTNSMLRAHEEISKARNLASESGSPPDCCEINVEGNSLEWPCGINVDLLWNFECGIFLVRQFPL